MLVFGAGHAVTLTRRSSSWISTVLIFWPEAFTHWISSLLLNLWIPKKINSSQCRLSAELFCLWRFTSVTSTHSAWYILLVTYLLLVVDRQSSSVNFNCPILYPSDSWRCWLYQLWWRGLSVCSNMGWPLTRWLKKLLRTSSRLREVANLKQSPLVS